MFQVLFLLFIVIPIVEIAVLLQVGEIIGGWPTVGIVIFTAWLGAFFVRQQGLATVQNLQLKMAQGEMPSEEIVAGLLLLVSGVFLVTPGFVTDAIGLSLLIPQVRLGLVKLVQGRLIKQVNIHGQYHGQTFEHQADPMKQDPFERNKIPESHHQGETLDGEYERKE